MAHAQCGKKLSLLQSSAHALTSCELAFTQARLQHNHLHTRGHQTLSLIDLTVRVTSIVEGYHCHSERQRCIDTLVDCIYFSNHGNKWRAILKSSSGMTLEGL